MPDDDAFDDSGYMIRDGKRTDPAAQRAAKERASSVRVEVPGRRPMQVEGFNSREIAGFVDAGDTQRRKNPGPPLPKGPKLPGPTPGDQSSELKQLLGGVPEGALIKKRRRPNKRMNVGQASIGEMSDSRNGGAGSEQ